MGERVVKWRLLEEDVGPVGAADPLPAVPLLVLAHTPGMDDYCFPQAWPIDILDPMRQPRALRRPRSGHWHAVSQADNPPSSQTSLVAATAATPSLYIYVYSCYDARRGSGDAQRTPDHHQ
jgi:hypothetical protein